MVILWGGVAFGSTIAECYADAESENAGLSVTVKVSGVTMYSGGDLEDGFDAVAQYHSMPGVAATYNADGRAALRQAMDCLFDSGYVTLSSAWLQANVEDLEVRNHGVGVFSGSTPVWTGEFNEVDVISGYSYLRFNGYSVGHCLAVESSALGDHDLQADFTATGKLKMCAADECSKCKRSTPSCSCKTGDGECDYEPIVSSATSNGVIIRVSL